MKSIFHGGETLVGLFATLGLETLHEIGSSNIVAVDVMLLC